MDKAWTARSAAEREAVEAAFVARHGAELLLAGETERAPDTDLGTRRPRRLPIARLYAAVHGDGPWPAEVSEALRAEPELRDELALLLERTAWQRLPRAAAASGRGGLQRREANGCTLRVVASRAACDQVYLLIELPEEISTDTAVPDPHRPHDGAGSGPTTRLDEGDAGALASPGPAHEDRPVRGPRERSDPAPGTGAPGRNVVRTADGGASSTTCRPRRPAPSAS